MSDIFEEVDEAVASDKATRLWRAVRGYLYALVVLIVVGVAGFEFYKWQNVRSHEAEASAFHDARQALEANDYVAAEALFTDIMNSESSFADLAGHYLAQVKIAGMGDRAGAIEALETVGQGDDVVSQVALMKAAYLQADSLTVDDLVALLEPVLSSDESHFTFLAEELVASRAYQLGDYAEARQRLSRITVSLDASQTTKSRAQQAIAALDAIEQSNGVNP